MPGERFDDLNALLMQIQNQALAWRRRRRLYYCLSVVALALLVVSCVLGIAWANNALSFLGLLFGVLALYLVSRGQSC